MFLLLMGHAQYYIINVFEHIDMGGLYGIYRKEKKQLINNKQLIANLFRELESRFEIN